MRTYPNRVLPVSSLVLSVLFLASTIVCSCSSKRSQHKYFEPPVASIDIPFHTWTISSDQDTTILLPTGTSLHIPAGAFAKNDGSLVSGTVEFRAREFHDAIDIFRAGIPMWTDQQHQEYLRSAGMIELRARKDEQELKLADGKELDISLAGFRSSANYSLYYLDEGNGWGKTGSFSTDSNRIKLNKIAMLDTLPEKPEDPEGLEDQTIDLITNLEENAYLKAFSGLKWRIRKKDLTNEIEEAMRVHWDNVKIRVINKRKMKYELTFTAKLKDNAEKTYNKTVKVIARPELSGKKLEQAKADFEKEMVAYEGLRKKWEEEQSRLAMECDLLNTFKANQLGIWNIDYLQKINNPEYVETDFDFEEELRSDINKISIYMILQKNNSCVKLSPGQWRTIGFDPAENTRLIAVLPGETLAIVPEQVVQNIIMERPAKAHFMTERSPAKALLKPSGGN